MICTKCSVEKTEDNFDYVNKAKGKRRSICKECRRQYTKEHYKQNVQIYKDRARISRPSYVQRNRDFIYSLREELKCTQCGEDHIAVLDFHHSDPEQKEFSISRAISDGVSLSKIQDEINKCIVLCSNCHRKLHWNERNMPT